MKKNPQNQVKRQLKAAEFFKIYCENGYNATAAVMQLMPHLTKKSASVEASVILDSPTCQQLIKQRLDSVRDLTHTAHVTVNSITQQLEQVRDLALEKGDYMSVLKALEQLSKLHKLYDTTDKGANQYKTFIKSLIIQHSPASMPAPVVDISPDNPEQDNTI